MKKIVLGILLLLVTSLHFGESVYIKIHNISADKVYLFSLSGEKTALLDSIKVIDDGIVKFSLSSQNYHRGFYRILFEKNKVIDFVNDSEDINIETSSKSVLDSMVVHSSKSNELFYAFIKINKLYKTKTELLQLILARYPKEDDYYKTTIKRLTQLQNEYVEFVNIKAQANPQSFIAKYIQSAQLPIIDIAIPMEKQLAYLKANALNNVDFNSALLINSDLFANKSIEYLTYYRNPQLPLELLEKEFMVAIDSILTKARVNQLVYQHVTEYLIDGFKKFGFDKVLDYIVENYVIKDDLCLDVKTEGLIKRRIDQAKHFKIGSAVPNIVLPDSSGKNVDLAKIKSSNTLIVFYASWCPHCKTLLPQLAQFYSNQKDKKLEIVAVSLDEKRKDWTGFISMNKLGFINVWDSKGWDGKTANDYFIYATPTMLLLDKDKKIISKPTTFEQLKSSL